MTWSLVLHGGAGMQTRGSWPEPATETAARHALATALAAGTAILSDGGTALDAVEAALIVLEDDPTFNAGRGAVFTAEGKIELDAAIMDGRTRNAGAVAGVRCTRSPVQLARAVMDHSPHVFLAGQGADKFAREQGFEAVDQGYFATAERREQLETLLANPHADFTQGMKFGTIGAVALDSHGHVAAATSTGGMTGKKWGRVGDSPLIGAGTYADDRACAVSCTGAGEAFIRLGVAHEIAARVRLAGFTPQAAANSVLAELDAIKGQGGVIYASRDGCGWRFNTAGMYRAMQIENGEPVVSVYGDEA
ncbi:Isoaspartyl peptidase/L-asparaginase [Sphingomonas antarctica]|uniref:isoaspartyl peptidase/L-asparaginase family protein n=1 Tax=Sphingomonas antarctica TaxID=2040274 RepID=UPI0039E846DB